MKSALLLAALLLGAAQPLPAATNDLTAALQKGLFEEEANRNLPAAIQAYQAIAARFDEDRRLAATAIFRLGECYRKQGATNDAAAHYQRILREFADQQPLATLSRQNLAGMGLANAGAVPASVADAARQEQKRLLVEEIKLAENQLAARRQRYNSGIANEDSVATAQKEVFELKRQLAALDAGPARAELLDLTGAKDGGSPVTSTEAEEITRIRDLIQNSPDLINAKDSEGTPLHHAATKGQLVVARYLLDNGADINSRGPGRATPLYRAAALGHRAMVELLLARNAEVDAPEQGGRTPLDIAASFGYKSVAEVLLAHKADPNARDQDGRTPLHIAAGAGQAVLVELLLANHADINAKDSGPPGHGDLNSEPHTRGATPLVVAIMRKQPEIVKLLLAHQADINSECETYDNSVTWPSGRLRGRALNVAVFQFSPDLVDLLLKAGADPNARGEYWDNGFGWAPTTPLLLASWNSAEELSRSLLAAKADPNVADRTGATPLHNAVNRRSTDVVKLLLAKGAAINPQDGEGQTPLMRACLLPSPADFPIVSLLLDHQADPNLNAQNGDTALHFAIRRARKELVELLLAKGANPNLRNNKDLTALDELLKPASPPFGIPPPGLVPSRQGSGGRPGSTPDQRAEPNELADLLRQHGANVDVPHLDRIEIRRPASGFSQTVFSKGTNDYNHFSLMELIAVHYGFVGLTESHNTSRYPGAPAPFGFSGNSYTASGFVLAGSLSFPSFEQVIIRRPTPDGQSRTAIPVNLSAILRSAKTTATGVCDCSRNPVLEWGDVVEIPEADHPINATWQGLAEEDATALHQCLDRRVQVTVKGVTTNLVLALMTQQPPEVSSRMPGQVLANPPAFTLLAGLHSSGLLRASSDLTRVKVRRRDPATGQSYDLVFDCSLSDSGPNFWLRDGDTVEVPEKP